MKRLAGIIAAFLVSLGFWEMPAQAQIPGGAGQPIVVTVCGTPPSPYPGVGLPASLTIGPDGKMCVATTVSTSVTGFAPGNSFATLTASGSSGSVALPPGQAVVVFQNQGTAAVSCALGVGSATALVNETLVQAGGQVPLTVGSNTWGACIDQTGSTNNLVVLTGGSGLWTGGAGGGGSGGGGGAVTMALNAVATGAYSSGSIASGAYAAGSIASGAVASGAFASGALASGAIADGGDTTLGAKADAKNTATDTTAITVMQVLKEISAMEQAPASRAVTNAGTFATQSAITAASGSIASGAVASGAITSGAIASGAVASGAVASGAYASGSVSDGAVVTLGAKADAKSAATDTTAITAMQVFKEISYMVQNPASVAVTNGGTFAVQAAQSTASNLKTLSDIVGNGGATLDSAIGGGTAPTNMVAVGGQYNSSPITLTNTQASAVQLDANGFLEVNIKAGAGSGGTALADGATFSEGVTSFTPVGGEYVSGGGASCTTGKGCTAQMTIDRMVYENVGKINGVAPLMGNGVTGTGSQRVTIASDNTAFSVNSTLSAETTKNIGTIRVTGNVGGVMDAVGQNVTAPANWLQAGCEFTTTPTTITTGNGSPLSCDNANNLNVNVKTATGLAQGSTTSGQTGSLVMGAASTNAPTATTGDTWPLSISPASGGVRIDLKDTASNTNSFLVNVASGGIASGAIASGAIASGAVASGAIASGAIASGAAVSGAFADGSLVTLGAKADAKSTATDTTAITIMQVLKEISAMAQAPAALAAGTNLVGKVGIDQTTVGTTNAVSIAQIGATTVVNGGLAGSLAIGGTAGNNATITSNPLNLGAQAVTSENTANTTAKQTQLVSDKVGKLIVLPYANPENFHFGATAAMTGTTSTVAIAAVSSQKIYMTHLICTNSHATVGTLISVQDGSGGTTLYSAYAAPAGGGFSATLPVPIYTTAGNGLYVVNGTTGSNTYCSASGYSGV